MTYCNETTAVNYEPTKRTAVSLPCKAWTCPDCAELRKQQLIAEGIHGEPRIFLTLTMRRRPGMRPEEAAHTLAHAWRVARLRAMREARRDPARHREPFGAAPREGWTPRPDGTVPRQVTLWHGELEYLAVCEPHESGWPHLHLLVRAGWIGWLWLKTQMQELCDGEHVHIQRIENSASRAAYCAKYCTKCVTKIGTAKRYWQSRKYSLRPNPYRARKDAMKGRWERVMTHLLNLRVYWELDGWTCEYHPDGVLEAFKPPTDT